MDLCNAFSLVFATPCAVFDVTKIEGRIDVKHGTGKEVYETFSGEDEIIEDGDYVECAVSGKKIPIKDLLYWNVELQEAYFSPKEVKIKYEKSSLKK